ncbi:hypothetical protein CYMTET_39396 [Cymbomonas tetramitiformis]|uniref:Uncharacterized protein n=1 Tax=Cymbomonas tetramitiformis TaxID=36881 RepID=A0AAE0F5M9_9CHLO|nr:hypothetical protein CYMTET_39396 [Cymbomonas tetramitiformis]
MGVIASASGKVGASGGTRGVSTPAELAKAPPTGSGAWPRWENNMMLAPLVTRAQPYRHRLLQLRGLLANMYFTSSAAASAAAAATAAAAANTGHAPKVPSGTTGGSGGAGAVAGGTSMAGLKKTTKGS